MPISKTKWKNAASDAKSAALPSISKELLDPFVTGPMTGEAVNAVRRTQCQSGALFAECEACSVMSRSTSKHHSPENLGGTRPIPTNELRRSALPDLTAGVDAGR
jgi:hypothetical protein